MLILLGIPYNSAEAIELADKIMGFINDRRPCRIARAGKEKGRFPELQGFPLRPAGRPPDPQRHRHHHCPDRHDLDHRQFLFRGGTAFLPSPTSGRSWTTNILVEVHPQFEKIAKERGFYSPELMQRIARARLRPGHGRNPRGRPQDLRHGARYHRRKSTSRCRRLSRNIRTTPSARR